MRLFNLALVPGTRMHAVVTGLVKATKVLGFTRSWRTAILPLSTPIYRNVAPARARTSLSREAM